MWEACNKSVDLILFVLRNYFVIREVYILATMKRIRLGSSWCRREAEGAAQALAATEC